MSYITLYHTCMHSSTFIKFASTYNKKYFILDLYKKIISIHFHIQQYKCFYTKTNQITHKHKNPPGQISLKMKKLFEQIDKNLIDPYFSSPYPTQWFFSRTYWHILFVLSFFYKNDTILLGSPILEWCRILPWPPC